MTRILFCCCIVVLIQGGGGEPKNYNTLGSSISVVYLSDCSGDTLNAWIKKPLIYIE